jgi:inorganic triphosphatase YgiF
MTRSLVERELKFDVGPGFVVPDVQSDLPSGTHKVASTEQLRSEYYDTADHALLRARMVLRRRTGSTDTGWQLKIPDGSFREEIRIEGQASERA